MMNTSMLSKDLGTVLVGEDAVTAGLVNEVGGIDKAYQKLRGLMKDIKKETSNSLGD